MLSKLRRLGLLAIILFALTAQIPSPTIQTSPPASQYDGRMYVLESNETATVLWDAVVYPLDPTLPVIYDYRLVMFNKTPLTSYQDGETHLTQVTFTRPRTEFFRAEVRACGDVDGDGIVHRTTECSVWAESTDPQYGIVDGQPEGWWLFWKIPTLQP